MMVNVKDFVAGVVLTVVGCLFAFSAVYQLPLGTARRMGPGFFPAILAALLVVLGLILIFQTIGKKSGTFSGIPWRAIVFVTLAPLLFAFLVVRLGFVFSVMGAFVLTALASPRTSIAFAFLLSVGMTVFCVLVFIVALHLPIPLFGQWLQF